MKMYSYIIKRAKASNTVYIAPLIGKKFTDEEVAEMFSLLKSKSIPWVVHFRENNWISVTKQLSSFDEMSDLIEDILPKKLTKKQIEQFRKEEEKRRRIKEKEAKEQQHYSKICQFFDKYFGENMNAHSKRTMVEVITGKVKPKKYGFKGVVTPSHGWTDGLKALGIFDENNKYPKSESGGITAYRITLELKDAYFRMAENQD